MFDWIELEPHQTRTSKVLSRDLEEKRCLIIDRSYTGKTLTHMAEIVRNIGGYPIRLGLFPKSRFAVAGSEYTLFLDKVLESSNMDLEGGEWPIKYYKEILSNS
jgi:hypothetical protein